MKINPEFNWLFTPADVLPPVETRAQEIPLNKLTPKNFERLCLRLVEKEAVVEHCQVYGREGQAQHGIDLYVKVCGSERYVTWQCKRHQTFDPSDVVTAVTKFLEGPWAGKCQAFVLAVTVSCEDTHLADSFESERARLNKLGIEFIPLGLEKLSTRLKPHADIVDEFFGRAYAEAFCDETSSERLKRKTLNPGEVIRLRGLLRRYYAEHFEATDRGLPQAARVTEPFAPLPLSERYVLQDLLVTRTSTTLIEARRQQNTPDSEVGNHAEQSPADNPRIQTVPVETRIPSLQWVGECDLGVVLGDPGVGKTAFMRYLILDLLAENPRHAAPAARWGRHLPVWVPFALWAQMASQPDGKCALSDVLHRWLDEMAAPTNLHELVARALDDDRLLLFVDGLDEWNHEDGAKKAVTLLEVFVGTRGVPSVASSRPHGFARLGGLSSRWKIASLAPLSQSQQRNLALLWFTHWHKVSSRGKPDEQQPVLIGRRLDALFEELAKDASLEKLAGIPLLFSSLLALHLAEHELPRSRFKAYEKMIELLLRVQPARRRTAALIGFDHPRLRADNRERTIAFLAFEIHRSQSATGISSRKACEVLSNYLQGTFAKQPDEAREIAEEMIPVGSDTTGLLVEKAPQSIGIVHRAFQEFLTARHLTTLSTHDARTILEAHWTSPQWHHVVLAFCYLTRPHAEVDALVDSIRNAPCPGSMRPSKSILLAEIAFHDLNCSATVARSIATEIFNIIECDSWLPGRSQLLDQVLDGLHSDTLATASRDKISEWFPCRVVWRHGLIDAIENWPKDDALLGYVFRILQDEEPWNQQMAASALQRKWGKDPQALDRLVALLKSPTDSNTTAAALVALYKGWPETSELRQLVDESANSRSSTVRMAGVCGKVSLGMASHSDKESLLHFDDWAVERCWRGELIDSLVIGWPRDDTIKRRCIKSLQRHTYERGMLDWGVAGTVLFRGFAGDEEVAREIAGLFERDRYPEHHFGNAWHDLAGGFGGHPIVSPAVDAWMTREKAMIYESAHAALVSRSVAAKHHLLSINPDKEPWPHWLLWALVQVWGASDEEVKAFALRLFLEPSKAIKVAHFIPDFVVNKSECRGHLLELLKLKEPERLDFVFKAARRIGIDYRDEEFVSAALCHDYDTQAFHRDTNSAGLFATLGLHPRVRVLALKELARRDGELSTLASAYHDDLEIRSALMRLLAPLPRSLRLQITKRLGPRSHEDDFTRRKLGNYDFEADIEIKSVASIAYYEGLLACGVDVSESVARLRTDLNAIGPDFESRRAAAFAGLIALGKSEEAVIELKKEKNKSLGLRLSDLGQQNIELINYIGTQWDSVQRAFEGEFLAFIRGESETLLDSLVTTRQDLPEVRQLVEQAVERKHPLREGIFRSFAAMHRRSDRLCNLCKDLVSSSYYGDWHHASEAIVAAEILGEQFCEDAELGNWLINLVSSDRPSSAALVALCIGWFNKPELAAISKNLLDRERFLLVPAKFGLLLTTVEAPELAVRLSSVLDQLEGSIWDFLPQCSRSVLTRMNRDAVFAEIIFKRLQGEATSSEKATLPRLLSRSPNVPQHLLPWCEVELKRQSTHQGLGALGLDLVAGKVRPVAHSLLDVAAFTPR